MSNDFDFQIPANIPVNSTLQDLEENDDSFAFNDEEMLARGGKSGTTCASSTSVSTSRRSRNSRKLSSSNKQENFFSDNQKKDKDNNTRQIEDNCCYYYDNDIEDTDLKEITSITRINQSNKVILKSFQEKYPTSIRIPSERALSSSSSFNSLTDQFENNEEYESQFYNNNNNNEDDDGDFDEGDGYVDEADFDDNNCLDVLERKMSSNLVLSNRRPSSMTKSMSKSDLNRIYKELNEIHNRLVVSIILLSGLSSA